MSPKELLYIEDSLGHLQQIQCLCRESAATVTDPELKNLISSVAQKQGASFSRFYGLFERLRKEKTMQDKEIMENLLLNLKGECDLMMHGAIESSTGNVHSAFTETLSDTLSLQNQVYSMMAKKGWYPAQAAQQTQIDSVKQKYSQPQ